MLRVTWLIKGALHYGSGHEDRMIDRRDSYKSKEPRIKSKRSWGFVSSALQCLDRSSLHNPTPHRDIVTHGPPHPSHSHHRLQWSDAPYPYGSRGG